MKKWIFTLVILLVAPFALASDSDVPPVDWEDDAYLITQQDVALDTYWKNHPLEHWHRVGLSEGRRWKPDEWSSADYLSLWADVRNDLYWGARPLAHYWIAGKNEGRSFFIAGRQNPPPGWDAEGYLERNPDVKTDIYWGVRPLGHWFAAGQYEGRHYSGGATVSRGEGEIIDFVRLPECDSALSVYFAVGKVDGQIHFGTYGYQNGRYDSKIYRYPRTKVAEFNAESVFAFKTFKGFTYATVEHGQKSTVDRGMIYRYESGLWREVYRHPSWNIMLELHEHDGYLYATGMNFDDRSNPAGVVRSSDGITWSVWFANPNEYRFFGMASRGSELWFAATSGGVSWGANNSNPSVFNGSSLVWQDSSRPNDGFWAIAEFKGDIFVGGTGRARVVRMSDRRTVLDMPEFATVHHMIVDKLTNTLLAFVSRNSGIYSSGAKIMATKDGANWRQVGPTLDCPGLFWAYQDEATGEIWVGAGRWHQGNDGWGWILRSRRR